MVSDAYQFSVPDSLPGVVYPLRGQPVYLPERAVLTMRTHQTSQIIAVAIILMLSSLSQAITPGGKRAPNYLVPLNPAGIYGSLNVRVIYAQLSNIRVSQLEGNDST